MERNYWAIHFGVNNKFANLGYAKGFIAVGWRELKKDLTEYNSLDKREFFEKLNSLFAKAYKNQSPNSRSQSIGQLFRFAGLMGIDDIILMPKSDEGKLYLGIIDSDYYYQEKADECDYLHRRKVKWLKELELSKISQSLKNSLGSIMTVFSVAEHSQEIGGLVEESAANLPTESQEEFTMESHLEGFIIENWEKLELGKKYDIYFEEGEKKGQYVTPIGRIDILARSKNKKEWLVIELKKGRSGHEVVGQILKYIGWIKENECPKNEKVKGLIILSEKDEGIIYALKAAGNIGLMTYSVSFKLKSEKLK